MVSPTLPWPLDMGSKIRIYHVLRTLALMGHEVVLVALRHASDQEAQPDALRPYCADLRLVPVEHRSRVRAAVRALLKAKPYRVAKFETPAFQQEIARALQDHYDILWVHFTETLAHVPPFTVGTQRPLVVLDQHNADERFWMTYARQGHPWVRGFARFNLWQLRRFQQTILQVVDVVLSVSAEDAEFTRKRLPRTTAEVWVVPNGVDTAYLKPAEDRGRRNVVIFCGAMDVRMNVDAVKWFARHVLPRVRKVIADVEFWVVGRNPGPSVKALASLPGVRVTGRVADVRPYYAQARVAIAPFRYGGGTKLKVLEAMALGVPVVATPVGCQGIQASVGKHLLVAQTAEAFAESVVTLLRDETRRREIAAAARRLVEAQYSWEGILRQGISRLERRVEEGWRA